MELEEALERHVGSLMGLPGVVGVGETEFDGKPAVIVMLAEGSPEVRAAIPDNVAGYPVVVEVTGEISAFPDE